MPTDPRDAVRAQQIARWFPPRLCDCTVMEDRCAACAPLAEAVERALTEVRDDAYTACSALGWKTPKDLVIHQHGSDTDMECDGRDGCRRKRPYLLRSNTLLPF